MNAQRLRICLVSEEFPPESGWGGIGTYSYNLAHGLAELGHRVHVIARGWGERTHEDEGDLTVHRMPLPEPSWRRGTHAINARLPESRVALLWNGAVARVIREISSGEGLDVIESPEYHSQALLKSLRGIPAPLVVRLHTPSFLCNRVSGEAVGGSRLDTWLSERSERMLTTRADLITCPSRYLASVVSAEWDIPEASIRVMPNPIDEDTFSPMNVQQEEPLVLCVARLQRLKGVEVLADAIPLVSSAIPEARFMFVGKDHPGGKRSTKDKLLRLLAGNGVPPERIEFRGHVDRTELPHLYNSAAVSVVPSLYENFPYTCLEAMACGIPVVCSATGGIPEIVTDRIDGLLVPTGASEALGRAIVEILRDPEFGTDLGRQARKTIETRYSRRAIAAEMADLYRSVLAQAEKELQSV